MSTKNVFDKEEAERIFCRLRAYCNSIEDAINEDDFKEVVHLAEHAEQEAHDLASYVLANNVQYPVKG